MFPKNKKHEDFFFHFAMTLRQRSGFILLLILILLTELIIQFYPFGEVEEPPSFSKQELAVIENFNRGEQKQKTLQKSVELFKFNPNALDEQGFIKLGFSAKQAKSIIKYRYVVGGNFATVEEFGASYVVSDKKLEELRPYIQLNPVKVSRENKNNLKKPLKVAALRPFQLNSKDLNGFIKLGFSEKQARTIINYKNSLPQKAFQSAEQFSQCYAVNDYMYRKLKPYIIINKPTKEEKVPSPKLNYRINTLNVKEFVDLGFSKKEASNVVKYRDFIGGFKDLQAFENCDYVNKDLYDNIKERIIID